MLRELKADPLLCSLAVVILTSSDAEKDLIDAYHLPAYCYITKPVTLSQLIAVVHSVANWGFIIVKK